jgi:hypothetical protein
MSIVSKSWGSLNDKPLKDVKDISVSRSYIFPRSKGFYYTKHDPSPVKAVAEIFASFPENIKAIHFILVRKKIVINRRIVKLTIYIYNAEVFVISSDLFHEFNLLQY